MDEQTLNNQQVTPTATQAAQQTTPLQSSVTAQPADNLPAGVSDYSAQIAQMYDAQMAAKQQSMEDAYNQNMTTMQRAREQIAPTYFNQGNDLATQYERTRRNNNMRADMNGLNTGAASQMDLAQQSNYLDAFGQIRTAQANAERQADQQIADLEVAYKSQVAQALADNDYQKATALLQEYQRRDNAAEEMRRYNQQQDLANAKLRAAYGDFGGYEALYGADTANAMREFFLQANPDYAYANGLMDVDKYYKLTGKYPAGYTPPSSGRGGYSRGGGNNGNSSAAESMIQQLVLQGVPYQDALQMMANNATSFDEYKAGIQLVNDVYSNSNGLFNAAGNSDEVRGARVYERPKGVQPTQGSKYSGG